MIKESDATAICRNFAPLYGIDEESATGTVSCALACCLFKYYKQQSQYIFEQGYNMGKTVVTAIGAGVGVWGVINLLEGYGYLLLFRALHIIVYEFRKFLMKFYTIY